MSLFLEERIAEQIDDRENDQLTFTFPWIIPIASTNQTKFGTRFRTCFKVANESWTIFLLKRRILMTCSLSFNGNREKFYTKKWNGACYVSYTLYQDNDMLIDLYSSPKIQMDSDDDSDLFDSGVDFITQCREAITNKSAAKVVFFFEFVLPSKAFYYPFKRTLSEECCKDYPADMENDINFSFLNKGDFTIQCSDGTVSAYRSTLFTSSEFLNYQLSADFKDDKIIVDHSVEVVRPIIIFLHTFCFQMPETYDLEYAQRLLKAIDYFQPYQRDIYNIKEHVHFSLCDKFVTESQNFDTILRWTSLSCQQSLHELSKMVVSTIARKYYFKWSDTFPLNERNIENQLYRDIFGEKDAVPNKIFRKIDKISVSNIFNCVNVVLS